MAAYKALSLLQPQVQIAMIICFTLSSTIIAVAGLLTNHSELALIAILFYSPTPLALIGQTILSMQKVFKLSSFSATGIIAASNHEQPGSNNNNI